MRKIKPKVEKYFVDELLPRHLLLGDVFDGLFGVLMDERHEHPMIRRGLVSLERIVGGGGRKGTLDMFIKMQ